ncbi:helix-turn-helix domain-containing protein [Raoultella planticola]|uniref:helix-turn-helix domain-containing protein n=1 Tax=Raoultella planticola TaxID=575 RepID=UPI001F53AD66|nr:helix-turn-helix domain-containing protein [Raoultella planticola]UNK75072.1 helix-turn-helix domain-containing protein [Raoultella planticola]
MRKVKHQFTLRSMYDCLSRSKAIIYNGKMSEKNSTDSLITRLTELNKKGISKTEMSRIAGVSKQAVSGWFRTGRISKESALALADAAGVSVPWLLGEDVGEKDGLKPDEQRLLELYRQLPEEEQQNMLRVVSLRLKELDELYAKYMGRRIKGDTE